MSEGGREGGRANERGRDLAPRREGDVAPRELVHLSDMENWK